jgi:hypothetical protein
MHPEWQLDGLVDMVPASTTSKVDDVAELQGGESTHKRNSAENSKHAAGLARVLALGGSDAGAMLAGADSPDHATRLRVSLVADTPSRGLSHAYLDSEPH